METIFEQQTNIPIISRTISPVVSEKECEDQWKKLEKNEKIKILNGFNAELTNGMLNIIRNYLNDVYPQIEIIDFRENFLTSYCFNFVLKILREIESLKFFIILKNPVHYSELWELLKTKLENDKISENDLSKLIWIPAWKIQKIHDQKKPLNKYTVKIVENHYNFYKYYAKHLNLLRDDLLPEDIRIVSHIECQKNIENMKKILEITDEDIQKYNQRLEAHRQKILAKAKNINKVNE